MSPVYLKYNSLLTDYIKKNRFVLLYNMCKTNVYGVKGAQVSGAQCTTSSYEAMLTFEATKVQ